MAKKGQPREYGSLTDFDAGRGGEYEITSFRVEVDDFETAKRILEGNGLTMGIALGIFLKQVILYGGLPFPIRNERSSEVVKPLERMEKERELTQITKELSELKFPTFLEGDKLEYSRDFMRAFMEIVDLEIKEKFNKKMDFVVESGYTYQKLHQFTTQSDTKFSTICHFAKVLDISPLYLISAALMRVKANELAEKYAKCVK